MLDSNASIDKSSYNLPYFNIANDSKERFSSYWHQINEIFQLTPSKILEVGIGNGFVSKYLKKRGAYIVTLDIVYGLIPDVVGSVLKIPFAERTFEVVTCFEVLEHLPYDEFKYALNELAKVSKRYLLLSLPDVTPVYRLNIEVPKIKPIKKLIKHPFPRSVKHIFDDSHHWEIGHKGYPLKRINNDITNSDLEIIKTYRIFDFYYHRFFLLEKNSVNKNF